jgi:hypothetical protein
MIPRLLLVIALLVVASPPPVSAARAATSSKRAPVAKSKHAQARRSAPATKPAPSAKAAPPDSAARLAGGPRRLEDIHIEGEIPAPQVLFVTARDQRRFTRFHHQRYLKTSAQVGETTRLPTRVALTNHPPTPAGAP